MQENLAPMRATTAGSAQIARDRALMPMSDNTFAQLPSILKHRDVVKMMKMLVLTRASSMYVEPTWVQTTFHPCKF
jgi:hypothetical protein